MLAWEIRNARYQRLTGPLLHMIYRCSTSSLIHITTLCVQNHGFRNSFAKSACRCECFISIDHTARLPSQAWRWTEQREDVRRTARFSHLHLSKGFYVLSSVWSTTNLR